MEDMLMTTRQKWMVAGALIGTCIWMMLLLAYCAADPTPLHVVPM